MSETFFLVHHEMKTSKDQSKLLYSELEQSVLEKSVGEERARREG